MNNPFEELDNKLNRIEEKLDKLLEMRLNAPALAEKPENTLMTETELLELLQISRTTSIVYRKKGMPYSRIGGRIYYSQNEVLNWINNY